MAADLTHSPPHDLDAALSRIDAQTQAAVDAVERARAFTATLAGLRGRGSVGGVRVTVDHAGLVLGVDYTDTAVRAKPQALSQATMAAVGAALDDVLAQLSEQTRQAWGTDPVADRIVAEATTRFAAVVR